MNASRYFAVAVLLAITAAPLMGQCDSLTLAGRESWDAIGEVINDVVNQDYSASGCTGGVTDISWVNAEVQAIGASWPAEAEIRPSASDGSGSPGDIDPFSSTTGGGADGPTSGSLGAGVTLLGDNILRLEWHESFDDATGVKDADWTAGTLNVTPVALQSFSVE